MLEGKRCHRPPAGRTAGEGVMDIQAGKPAAAQPVGGENGHYRWALGVLALLFFMWGFCTVLNDTLVPHLKAVFQMDYFQAALIQFVFFGAYFVLAIPAAWLIERAGYKYAIVVGLAIMGVGCLVFLPASNQPSYGLFLTA